MKRSDDQGRAESGLTPERMFVIQLRADCDPPQRRMHGRVEHVMSGESEPFVSLTDLLAFMARYTGAANPHTDIANKGGSR